MLDRLVGRTKHEFGDRLVSVWLFGSRARGERPSPDSDVDVLVVIRGRSRDDADRVAELLDEAAAGEQASPDSFSLHVHDPEWVAGRREAESFFMQEVARDAVVLAGEGVKGPPTPTRWVGMRPRTTELLESAREHADLARVAQDAGYPGGAISAGYYAMLFAARAALSEEERNAKTHGGTWSLFGQTFVTPGRFDPALFRAARKTQRSREGWDYHGTGFSTEEGAEVLALTARFLAAVGAMIEP